MSFLGLPPSLNFCSFVPEIRSTYSSASEDTAWHCGDKKGTMVSYCVSQSAEAIASFSLLILFLIFTQWGSFTRDYWQRLFVFRGVTRADDNC
ncbi:hypothetical protein CEXT_752571 [Caerostris extrusa]|uniref:Uncharacterized protein n=1 Tax=Caerostris extrusa TaxID=172846 RepID=A0AAV4S577_CAEEX|nr:hypothetical protein CEXT_752571 [Caerostris extrusa]